VIVHDEFLRYTLCCDRTGAKLVVPPRAVAESYPVLRQWAARQGWSSVCEDGVWRDYAPEGKAD
jgi:hypothetical protein